MGVELLVAVTGSAILVGIVLHTWRRTARLRRDITRGELTGATHGDIGFVLLREYGKGRLHPIALDAAAARPDQPSLPLLNIYVCLEVAAGRYREALAWRHRAKVQPDGLVLVNEAEALACLGRLEESLTLVEGLKVSGWLASGIVCHRVWILAELGRINEARQAMRSPDLDSWIFPAAYKAERHFSRFAVGLAVRDFALAHEALDAAEGQAVRESTKRNLHFYRGRLALAEGRDIEALVHFERGAQSPYKFQGGTSLLEWGDALKRLGREVEAREKWTWCVEQDPQSPAAVIARTRLEQVVAA
jgi:hypothetical protein